MIYRVGAGLKQMFQARQIESCQVCHAKRRRTKWLRKITRINFLVPKGQLISYSAEYFRLHRQGHQLRGIYLRDDLKWGKHILFLKLLTHQGVLTPPSCRVFLLRLSDRCLNMLVRLALRPDFRSERLPDKGSNTKLLW